MSDIVWEDPPVIARGKGGPRTRKWITIAHALREQPGKWALVQEGLAYRGRTNVVLMLEKYGTFEVISRTVEGKFNVYARYVGNGEVA